MKKTDPALLSILANVDALFMPIRAPGGEFDFRRNAAASVGRHAYATSGIVWHSKARTEQGRKAGQRAIEALAATDQVTMLRNARGVVGLKLTDAGEAHARALASVGSEYGAFLTMGRLAELGRGPWVPETALAGYAWGDNSKKAHAEFVLVSELAAWGLVRGWIATNSSCRGHAYYRLSDAGREQLASGWAPTEAADTFEVAAGNFYNGCLSAALDRLSGTRVGQDIGPAPLPVSMGAA